MIVSKNVTAWLCYVSACTFHMQAMRLDPSALRGPALLDARIGTFWVSLPRNGAIPCIESATLRTMEVNADGSDFTFGPLPVLQKLRLDFATALPGGTAQLTHLQVKAADIVTSAQYLDVVAGCRLCDSTAPVMPQEKSAGLHAVQELTFSCCRMSVIPDAVSRLTCLTSLSVGHQELHAIPTAVARLTNLRRLFIHNISWWARCTCETLRMSCRQRVSQMHEQKTTLCATFQALHCNECCPTCAGRTSTSPASQCCTA